MRVGQDRLVFSAVCLNLRTCERWLLLHPAKVRMPRAAIITVSLFIINRYFEAKVNYKFEYTDGTGSIIDLKCEKVALLEMRSHMAWYIKGLDGATHVKRMVTTVKTREEMMDIINRYQAYLNGDKSARLVVE